MSFKDGTLVVLTQMKTKSEWDRSLISDCVHLQTSATVKNDREQERAGGILERGYFTAAVKKRNYRMHES